MISRDSILLFCILTDITSFSSQSLILGKCNIGDSQLEQDWTVCGTSSTNSVTSLGVARRIYGLMFR